MLYFAVSHKFSKILTKHNQIGLINIDSQNLHKICKTLRVNNLIHLFDHGFSKYYRYNGLYSYTNGFEKLNEERLPEKKII